MSSLQMFNSRKPVGKNGERVPASQHLLLSDISGLSAYEYKDEKEEPVGADTDYKTLIGELRTDNGTVAGKWYPGSWLAA